MIPAKQVIHVVNVLVMRRYRQEKGEGIRKYSQSSQIEKMIKYLSQNEKFWKLALSRCFSREAPGPSFGARGK
jgi:hypothetical protein